MFRSSTMLLSSGVFNITIMILSLCLFQSHNKCHYHFLCFNPHSMLLSSIMFQSKSMLLSKTMFQSYCVLLSTNMTQSKSMLPSVIHVSIHNLMSLSSIMFQSKSMLLSSIMFQSAFNATIIYYVSICNQCHYHLLCFSPIMCYYQ